MPSEAIQYAITLLACSPKTTTWEAKTCQKDGPLNTGDFSGRGQDFRVYAQTIVTLALSLQQHPFPIVLTHLRELPQMIVGEVHVPRSSGGARWLQKLRLPLPGWSLPVIEKSSESRKKKIDLL